MHDSMAIKLDKLKNRLSEIETLLIDSETVKPTGGWWSE